MTVTSYWLSPEELLFFRFLFFYQDPEVVIYNSQVISVWHVQWNTWWHVKRKWLIFKILKSELIERLFSAELNQYFYELFGQLWVFGTVLKGQSCRSDVNHNVLQFNNPLPWTHQINQWDIIRHHFYANVTS